MANLPMEGCVTQVSVMREVKNLLELYLNPKDLKSGKKWPINELWSIYQWEVG